MLDVFVNRSNILFLNIYISSGQDHGTKVLSFPNTFVSVLGSFFRCDVIETFLKEHVLNCVCFPDFGFVVVDMYLQMPRADMRGKNNCGLRGSLSWFPLVFEPHTCRG